MKRTYSQLNDEERRKLELWRQAKVSPDVIAERLGRHRSTIYRELKRNHFRDEAMPKVVGYFWMVAKMKATLRRAKERKLIRHAELQGQVIDRIKAGWTPEQIAGRMRLEGAKPRVCQETIYRFVYSKEGMQHDLWWYLPEHRRKRRPRRARKRQAPKFCPENSILFRPDDVAHRRQFGHWEADLVLFRQKFGPHNLISLVERISRFTVLLPNADRRTRPIMAKLVAVLGSLPFKARRSITFDRGSEFIDWPHLQAHAGVQAWFCDPRSPWQKGTVENTNRRMRRWLPRDMDPTSISGAQLKAICDRLNATPRKCLGWRTPAEVFREKVLDRRA
ncbi:IS30 family transposase [Rubellimicrobium arenae]|uniref:IS30 family transposase n=1 Tax=Rubellimicrobium arenae TaxID=2817372 RepID=UPI001B309EB5|nr:IS30 family transposase [Rubellimicrobium arenae]